MSPAPAGLEPGRSRGRHGRRGPLGRLLARRPALRPSTAEVMARWLDEALPEASAVALDAGCGIRSQLSRFRPRIGRFVGVDVHVPARPVDGLDEFRVADLCRDADAFPAGSYDVCLSSFTVEHLVDPPAAFRTLHGWLRPGGWLVLTTVNRRHPLVDAYIGLPIGLRTRLQRRVKATAEEAHPLVGACNRPTQLRRALVDAGFVEVELVTTNHLARAWDRWLPAYLMGVAGDLVVRGRPGRRSTIVARARRPLR